jgi:hypothetical protein
MKDNKHIQSFNEHQENLNISDVIYSKKILDDKLIEQDFKSQIKAIQYIIDYYEIMSLSDIIKKRDTLSKQLKDWQLGNDKHQP